MTELNRPKELILGQFLEGLNQSAGAASLLIHHQQNTQWMRIRTVLETVKQICVTTAVDPILKPKKSQAGKNDKK